MQSLLCRLAAGAGLSWLGGLGCHVMVQSETMRPVSTEHIVHPEGAIAHRAALGWTETGRLRFVEPLECPTEEVVHQRSTIEIATRPNLATFTVGVIAAAAGGVMLTSGLFSRDPAGSPYTYLGAASAGVALPFVIGPWLGNRVEVSSGGEPEAVRRPGPSQPCGERPVAARSATLAVGGLEVHGAVDASGVFAVSPYEWIDAYGAASATPSELTAVIEGDAGARTISTVLDAAALATHAAGFLGHADFDPTIQPLKLVPGFAAATLRPSLVAGDGGPAVRVVLALRNDGPGDAWAVRGQITAPAAPAIDGRMIYIGKLARGAAAARELVIPVSARAAAALRGQTIELSVELRDAHGTAPSAPVRFRGVLLDEAARGPRGP
jgi:hypothetical protein